MSPPSRSNPAVTSSSDEIPKTCDRSAVLGKGTVLRRFVEFRRDGEQDFDVVPQDGGDRAGTVLDALLRSKEIARTVHEGSEVRDRQRFRVRVFAGSSRYVEKEDIVPRAAGHPVGTATRMKPVIARIATQLVRAFPSISTAQRSWA